MCCFAACAAYCACCTACKCCKCWLDIFGKLVKCVGKIAAYLIVIGIIVLLVAALIVVILWACGVFDGSNLPVNTTPKNILKMVSMNPKFQNLMDF